MSVIGTPRRLLPKMAVMRSPANRLVKLSFARSYLYDHTIGRCDAMAPGLISLHPGIVRVPRASFQCRAIIFKAGEMMAFSNAMKLMSINLLPGRAANRPYFALSILSRAAPSHGAIKKPCTCFVSSPCEHRELVVTHVSSGEVAVEYCAKQTACIGEPREHAHQDQELAGRRRNGVTEKSIDAFAITGQA